MSTDNEYRLQAAVAEKHPRLARNDVDREAWLRIAQGFEPFAKAPEEIASAAVRTLHCPIQSLPRLLITREAVGIADRTWIIPQIVDGRCPRHY
jgi:hypothetical protein